jgi:hypothetical protein
MEDSFLVDQHSISLYRSKSNDLVVLSEMFSALSISKRLLREIAVGFTPMRANVKNIVGVVPAKIC